MIIRKEFVVNANAKVVWESLGPNFTEVARWASAVFSSEKKEGYDRVCETSIGTVKENILFYDEKSKEITYDAISNKIPFFVKDMTNNWKVIPTAKDKCKVVMTFKARLLFPFNIFMFIPMRFQLGGVLAKAAEELKYYSENSHNPHPRKLKISQRASLRAS